jgi:hypothetical protein
MLQSGKPSGCTITVEELLVTMTTMAVWWTVTGIDLLPRGAGTTDGVHAVMKTEEKHRQPEGGDDVVK